MEDTKYGAARGLIKFVLVVNLLIGLLAAILGLLSIENARSGTEVMFSMLIAAGGIIFALVSYAIFEFFKAFLDLVDNSHVIKNNLLKGNDIVGTEKPAPAISPTQQTRKEPALVKNDSDSTSSAPPDFNKLVTEHTKKNSKGKTVTIFEFQDGSFIVENQQGRWERFDSLENAIKGTSTD